jgi:hypothetical protein
VKKSISTDQTKENIARILEILEATPDRLEDLVGTRYGVDPEKPLGPGERTPVEVLAHLVYTEARSSDHILMALLVDEPKLVLVHAQRDLGKLLRLEDQFTIPELLAYIRFRRVAMVRVLRGLTDKQWSRTADKGLTRMESVYWAARGLALHEEEHLGDLEAKLRR